MQWKAVAVGSIQTWLSKIQTKVISFINLEEEEVTGDKLAVHSKFLSHPCTCGSQLRLHTSIMWDISPHKKELWNDVWYSGWNAMWDTPSHIWVSGVVPAMPLLTQRPANVQPGTAAEESGFHPSGRHALSSGLKNIFRDSYGSRHARPTGS